MWVTQIGIEVAQRVPAITQQSGMGQKNIQKFPILSAILILIHSLSITLRVYCGWDSATDIST